MFCYVAIPTSIEQQLPFAYTRNHRVFFYKELLPVPRHLLIPAFGVWLLEVLFLIGWFQLVAYTSEYYKFATDILVVVVFTARCYASAVYAVIVCLSACLSVTNRNSTKMAKPMITQTKPYDCCPDLSSEKVCQRYRSRLTAKFLIPSWR